MKDIKTEVALCNSYIRSVSFDVQSGNNFRQVLSHPNPLARYGRQMFSQAFEDGITLEIMSRIKPELRHEFFLEIGSGDGTQNNTLALAALGWDGVWVDCMPLHYQLPNNSRVSFYQRKVNTETACDIALNALEKASKKNYDAVSIDVDGIDYYITEGLLKSGIRPNLWIIEYNALFIPPVKFVIDYDPNNTWDRTSHYGASLQSLVNLMHRYGYCLVCCTPATGTNAFFVPRGVMYAFTDVPDSIEDIYVGPHYRLDINFGHPIGVKLIQHLLDKTKTYHTQTAQA